MDGIFDDRLIGDESFYQEISDTVDSILGKEVPESQKLELYNYLLSVTSKSSNENRSLLSDNFNGSLFSSYPNYSFPSNNQFPVFNLFMPPSHFSPFLTPRYTFYPQPMIPVGQYPYITPQLQMPIMPQFQLPQLQAMPYFNLPPTPTKHTHTKKSKTTKKHDKKKDKKKEKKGHKSKPSKSTEKDTSTLIFTKTFSSDPFDGICSELNDQCQSNCNDEGIIEISGNIFNEIGYSVGDFSSLVDYEDESGPSYDSKDEPDSYIIFDFKNYLVSITNYSIRSSNNPEPSFLTHWAIEGSNDKAKWTTLDTRSGDTRLIGNLNSATFEITDQKNKNKKFQYIRIRITAKCTTDNYFLEMKHIEFFGSYYAK